MNNNIVSSGTCGCDRGTSGSGTGGNSKMNQKRNTNSNSILEILRLKNEGITQIKKYTPNSLKNINNLNVNCFLIQNLNIVQEFKFETLYDRLDIFSFVIDPNLFGDIEKYSICKLGSFHSKNELFFKSNEKERLKNQRISKQRINKNEEEKIKNLIHSDKNSLKNLFSKEEQQNIPILKNLFFQRKSFIIGVGNSKNNQQQQLEDEEEEEKNKYSIEEYSPVIELNENKNKKRRKRGGIFKSSTDELDDIEGGGGEGGKDIPNYIEYSILEDILEDENLFPYLKIYLCIENLSEYFIFYEEYLYFKKIKNFEKEKEFISNLFLIFFDPESILYLNLTDENRKYFNSIFNNQMLNKKFELNLFDDLLEIVKLKFEEIESSFKLSIYYEMMLNLNENITKRESFLINKD